MSVTRTNYLMSTVTPTQIPPSAECMTTEEEYHSLKETYKLLCHLIDPQKTPRVPKPIRDKAKHCLKYYPVRRTLKELEGGVTFFNPR